MSNRYGPRIVTDGLVLCLDPADRNCLKTNGTTCTNLATGGLVTGASGEPGSGTHSANSANFPVHGTHNGVEVFNFTGGKGMNCEEDFNISTHSFSVWIYKTNSVVVYLADYRNDGEHWYLLNYTDANINYYNAIRYNFTASYQPSHTGFINKWLHVTLVPQYSKLYLDGIEVSQQTKYRNSYVSQDSVGQFVGVNFRIGTRYNDTNRFVGYMGPLTMYNRSLTDLEVLQNYNATKGRFGL